MVTLTHLEYAVIRSRIETAKANAIGLTVSKIAASTPKRSKYGNVKTNWYDSKAEYHRAIVLNAMADNWDIKHLRKQAKFVLQESFKDSDGVRHKPITYVADFEYFLPDWTHVCEDVKGFQSEVYRIKKKLFIAKYPEIKFVETFVWKKS